MTFNPTGRTAPRWAADLARRAGSRARPALRRRPDPTPSPAEAA